MSDSHNQHGTLRYFGSLNIAGSHTYIGSPSILGTLLHSGSPFSNWYSLAVLACSHFLALSTGLARPAIWPSKAVWLARSEWHSHHYLARTKALVLTEVLATSRRFAPSGSQTQYYSN